MNESQRNIIVGLTAFAALVGLAGLLVLFGYVPSYMKTGYEVRVMLNHAGGLHADSGVTLSGISIGQVTSVQLTPDRSGVIVTALIEPEYRIPAGASVRVSAPVFGGGATIDFAARKPDPQAADEVAYLPTDGSAVVDGKVISSYAQLERLSEKIEQVALEWSGVGTRVKELIAPRDPAQVDAGDIDANLSTVLVRVDSRLSEIEDIVEGIRRYTDDQQMYEDVRQTVSNSRQVAERVTGHVETVAQRVDQVSETMNEAVTTLRNRYVAAANDLTKAVDSTRKLIDKVRDGKGTAGKLVNDPALYDNLDDAGKRLQKAIDELRLLAEKWKAEGVPIQF